MYRNSFPVMLMLLAGAITSIFVFIKDYSLPYRMLALLVSVGGASIYGLVELIGSLIA